MWEEMELFKGKGERRKTKDLGAEVETVDILKNKSEDLNQAGFLRMKNRMTKSILLK